MSVEWEIGNIVVIASGAAVGYFAANQAYKNSTWLRSGSGMSVAALVAIFFAGFLVVGAAVALIDHSGTHEDSQDDSSDNSG